VPRDAAPETLPRDWRWAELSELAAVHCGQTPPGLTVRLAQPRRVPWFKAGDLGRCGGPS